MAEGLKYDPQKGSYSPRRATNAQMVFCVRGDVAFGDDGSAVTLGIIPAGAEVVGITVDVTTAFDDTGTDLLDVGTSSTGTHFRADLDVSATGQTLTGWSNLGGVGTSPITATAQYDGANGDSTAGACTVAIFYVMSS